MKRLSRSFDGRGFSSVRAEKKVRPRARSAAARAYSALMMWLALPSPSGSPTTSRAPVSRMMSSAIAAGSEKILGIKISCTNPSDRRASLPFPAWAGCNLATGHQAVKQPGHACNTCPRTCGKTGIIQPRHLPAAMPPSKQIVSGRLRGRTSPGLSQGHMVRDAGRNGRLAGGRMLRRHLTLHCMAAAVGIAVGLAPCAIVPARADTLTQALVKAYQTNPQLNAERARQRATDENVPQALAGYRPQIVASLSGGLQAVRNLLPDNTVQSATLKPWTIGVTVTQTLFNGFKTAHSVRV